MENRIVIIGFGPAGMACAIQLKRMGLDPLVIEKDKPGGMVFNANLIENYPGFPKGIQGDKLAALLAKQASRFNIRVIKDTILNINYKEGIFLLKGNSGNYYSKILVIASGTSPHLPEDFKGDSNLKGLIHTDISGLRNTSGKSIGIIGAGDAAFDYAISMAENANHEVHIFNRGERIKALELLQQKVSLNSTIQYHRGYLLENLKTTPDMRLQAIFRENEERHEFVLDYIIFATGRNPALGMLGEKVKQNLGKLQEEHRLYLAGDVKNDIFRQLSIAIGDGVRTAMEIFQHESDQQNRE